MLKRSQLKLSVCFLSFSMLSACGGGDGGGSSPAPSSLTQEQRYDLLYRSTFGPEPDSYQELSDTVWTTDFSYEYVTINAEYRT